MYLFATTCILLHANMSRIFSTFKHSSESPLKEVNDLCFWGSTTKPTWKRSNRLSSWQMELGSSKWSYINTCGWKCYDSAYDALEKRMTGWVENQVDGSQVVKGEVVFCLKLGIRIRGLECFLEECRKIPLWVDIYTELGGGNSKIFFIFTWTSIWGRKSPILTIMFFQRGWNSTTN